MPHPLIGVLSVAASGVLALLVVPRSARAQAPAYIVDGQTIPLTADVSRIAVSSATADLTELMAEHGLPGAEVRSFPIAGWSLANVGAGRSTSAALLSALAGDERLDFVSPVFLDDQGQPLIVTPDILVRFIAPAERASHAQILAEAGVAAVLARDWAGLPGAYRVRHASRDGFGVLAAARALALRPEVAFAEPDFIFTGRGDRLPDDPEFAVQWGLHNTGQDGGLADTDVDAPEAWDLITGAESLRIVILDVGVEQTHPDLNQVPGADFTTDAGDGGPQNDCDRHGTWVAGCACAIIDNALGVVGAAPTARVASARIGISNPACNLSWNGQLSWTVDALAWAETIGARVTNNSNSYSVTSSAIREKYEQLRDAGVIHFASAGNDSSSGLTWPARLAAVNGVGSVDRFGTRSWWSNYGSGLAFLAPGEEIRTTDRTGSAGGSDGDYDTVDGTSFAAPIGAAAAALVMTLDPQLDAYDVETVLRVSCQDVYGPGFDSDSGWGVVNLRGALDFARTYRCWNLRGETGPPAVANTALAYDSARGVVVFFGGSAGATSTDQTWEWDGSAWTRRLPATAPSPRSGHAMVYDAARGVTVVFGGFVGTAPSAQTWEWDGGNWTQRTLPHSPPARISHALAFDAARGVTVLFGGRNSSYNLIGDTWEYDGQDWAQVASGGPSPRDFCGMAYDAARGLTLLYGGSVGSDELWAWNGSAWAPLSFTAGPGARERHALAYDAGRQTVLLFGGQDAADDCRRETYEWDGAQWTLRSLAGPDSRTAFAMAYDAAQRQVVLYGGTCDGATFADTWTCRLRERTFAGFACCLHGPEAAVDEGCRSADLDADGDVDLHDLTAFAVDFSLP